MRIGLIGIGQAGGKIADRLLLYDQQNNRKSYFVQECIAVNTARQDLYGLDVIPDNNRVLIGQSRVKGSGVGANNEEGMRVMEEDYDRVISNINSVDMHNIDAFIVVAALGGGTGSGGLPVLAREIKNHFTEPVFGLGILPSDSEGTIYSVNAGRSIQAAVNQTDNLMIFDNNIWNTGSSIENSYDQLNNMIAVRFGTLFSAGEVSSNQKIGRSVVDASEVINTLKKGGITTVGHAQYDIDPKNVNPNIIRRVLGWSDIDEDDIESKIRDLTRSSISGKLTLQVDISHSERALILYSGPSRYLIRDGIEDGISIIEREMDSSEVRGGDYPTNSPYLSATTVMSGIRQAPRIDELLSIAADHPDIHKLEEESDDDDEDRLFKSEITDDINELVAETDE